MDNLEDIVYYSIIADYNKTNVAFGFVSFQLRRSLVIALSLHIARWPLKMSHYPLLARRVYCDVNGGNCVQNGLP